ncbi:hypothetical protein FGO68_gene8238 [Halteria grandinella]|uniref:histidine kinase n=1 Tax=Halteria grandinella TaxID=5974 RepID=A0A8J8NHB2_HALGN|nr:hypothetical protein FGO68_gene8238 [Halteria grandinella]
MIQGTVIIAIYVEKNQQIATCDSFFKVIFNLKEDILNNTNYVAGVVHDLRNPLTEIYSCTELLSQMIPESSLQSNPELHQVLMAFKRNSENLISMVNNILDFAKIKSKKLELDLQPISIREFLDKILDMHNVKAKQKNLQLLKLIDDSLPERLYMDQSRLTNILVNLISNAIKFTEKGRVQLIANWQPDSSSGNFNSGAANGLEQGLIPAQVGMLQDDSGLNPSKMVRGSSHMMSIEQDQNGAPRVESRFDFLTPYQMISKAGAIQEPSFGNQIHADTLQRHFQSSLHMGSQRDLIFLNLIGQSISNPYQDSREELKASRENPSLLAPMTPQLNGGAHRIIQQITRPNGLSMNPASRLRKSTDQRSQSAPPARQQRVVVQSGEGANRQQIMVNSIDGELLVDEDNMIQGSQSPGQVTMNNTGLSENAAFRGRVSPYISQSRPNNHQQSSHYQQEIINHIEEEKESTFNDRVERGDSLNPNQPLPPLEQIESLCEIPSELSIQEENLSIIEVKEFFGGGSGTNSENTDCRRLDCASRKPVGETLSGKNFQMPPSQEHSQNQLKLVQAELYNAQKATSTHNQSKQLPEIACPKYSGKSITIEDQKRYNLTMDESKQVSADFTAADGINNLGAPSAALQMKRQSVPRNSAGGNLLAAGVQHLATDVHYPGSTAKKEMTVSMVGSQISAGGQGQHLHQREPAHSMSHAGSHNTSPLVVGNNMNGQGSSQAAGVNSVMPLNSSYKERSKTPEPLKILVRDSINVKRPTGGISAVGSQHLNPPQADSQSNSFSAAGTGQDVYSAYFPTNHPLKQSDIDVQFSNQQSPETNQREALMRGGVPGPLNSNNINPILAIIEQDLLNNPRDPHQTFALASVDMGNNSYHNNNVLGNNNSVYNSNMMVSRNLNNMLMINPSQQDTAYNQSRQTALYTAGFPSQAAPAFGMNNGAGAHNSNNSPNSHSMMGSGDTSQLPNVYNTNGVHFTQYNQSSDIARFQFLQGSNNVSGAMGGAVQQQSSIPQSTFAAIAYDQASLYGQQQRGQQKLQQNMIQIENVDVSKSSSNPTRINYENMNRTQTQQSPLVQDHGSLNVRSNPHGHIMTGSLSHSLSKTDNPASMFNQSLNQTLVQQKVDTVSLRSYLTIDNPTTLNDAATKTHRSRYGGITTTANANLFKTMSTKYKNLAGGGGSKESSGTLVLQVWDTGMGIPAEYIDNLFQPFGQAHKGIQKTHGGTGLGLWISKMIVELMGGTISLEITIREA